MALTSSNVFMFLICIPLYAFHVSLFFLFSVKFIQRYLPVTHPYYYIYYFIIIADILYMFVSLFGFRVPDFGLFQNFYEENGFLAGICWNLLSLCSMIQYFGRLFLCGNRFNYFFVVRKYDSIWKSKFPWYLIVIVLTPVILCSRHFTLESHFIFAKNQSINVSIDDPQTFTEIKFQNILVDASTCFVAFVLSFCSFVRLSLIKRGHNPTAMNRNEILLFYHSVVLITLQLLKFAVTLFQLEYQTDKNMGQFLSDMLIPVADCTALIGSISLYLINSNFRSIYQAFYGIQCGSEEPQFRRRYSVNPAIPSLQIHPMK